MINARVVVVMPVFEDREASTRLFLELAKTFGAECHVVAVDDGSIRQPVNIEWLRQGGVRGTVLRLKRNVGHQRAIATGIAYAAPFIRGDMRLVIMDSDGEDTPESIDLLLAALKDEAIDIVVATRRTRVETLKFKAFYQVYRRIFKLLSGRDLAFGNFMALKPAAARRLSQMSEAGIHVAAAALNSKLRILHIPVDRGPRYAGHSKMNFVGLALHGFKAMMVFSEDILVRVGIACTTIALLSVLGATLALILKIIGFATPGWFSIAVGVLFLVFLQTGATTLMSLMLAGSIKTAAMQINNESLIDIVFETDPS